MFGFLKDKLKSALNKFSKKVDEAPEEEKIVEKEVKIEAPSKTPQKSEPPKVAGKEKVSKDSKEKPSKLKQKESAQEPSKKAKPKSVKSKDEQKSVERKVESEDVVSQVEEQLTDKVEERVVKTSPVSVEKEESLVQNAKEASQEEQVKAEPLKSEEKKGFFSRLKESFTGKETAKEEPITESVEPKEVEQIAKPQPVAEEKSFFAKMTEKITTKKVSSEAFDEMFWDLELALLENNVALEVIEKIKADLKAELVDKPVARGKVEEVISSSLHKSLEGLFIGSSVDLLSKARSKKPLVVCFVGVNGSGKTTSIAKVANYLQKNNFSVVLAAADTFRAAAIDQLQLHADALGVKLVRHDYGSDPAAVAFDAIKHAESAKKDVVLIDTAGRLHSNVNLIDEMKKIMRVAKPDLKIFVGESITGNDCIEQAKKFDEAVGLDGIILSKADIDEKGGAAISVSFVTKKPILFLGVGQEYKDLQVFDKEKLLASIGL